MFHADQQGWVCLCWRLETGKQPCGLIEHPWMYFAGWHQCGPKYHWQKHCMSPSEMFLNTTAVLKTSLHAVIQLGRYRENPLARINRINRIQTSSNAFDCSKVFSIASHKYDSWEFIAVPKNLWPVVTFRHRSFHRPSFANHVLCL
ncbi:hypothetical protein BDW60DRAFT_154672 [Aspergillus nidulans var. acristatus]